jgi:hypothetical protein
MAAARMYWIRNRHITLVAESHAPETQTDKAAKETCADNAGMNECNEPRSSVETYAEG